MITIMKTKTFLNALDDAYAKGVSAGANAEAVKDREDQNRRLHDMFKYGTAYGEQKTLDEMGMIDLDDLDPSVFEEIENETVESV